MKKEYAAPEVEIIKFTPDRSIMDFGPGGENKDGQWTDDEIKEPFGNTSGPLNG